MKTAISLPDELFKRAEALATRLGIPRSRLYATALEVYLEGHDSASTTRALDAVYADQPSELDPALAAIQSEVLSEDW